MAHTESPNANAASPIPWWRPLRRLRARLIAAALEEVERTMVTRLEEQLSRANAGVDEFRTRVPQLLAEYRAYYEQTQTLLAQLHNELLDARLRREALEEVLIQAGTGRHTAVQQAYLRRLTAARDAGVRRRVLAERPAAAPEPTPSEPTAAAANG